jgi:alkanesulfonate monooxygenase SsuD/methylene tetrahydromethanopterin reductase-like flavin-dependent oxidoreductase (luciferase family)
MRGVWYEDTYSHHGHVFNFDDVWVRPQPVEDIPIWYGGQSAPAIDRAARLADAWSMSPIETRSKLSESADMYRDALEEQDRSYDEVRKPLRREAYVAEDDETAWEEVGESILYEYEDVYGDYDDIGHSFEASNREDAFEELREHAQDRFIIGGPETAIRELERYRDTLGVDEVLLRMHFPGLDPDLTDRSIELVAEEVMPHVG